MRALLSFKAWVIASLIWVTAFALLCWETWPRVPMDVSGNDPGTLTAYDAAVGFHVFQYATLGILGPLIALALGWLVLWVLNWQGRA